MKFSLISDMHVDFRQPKTPYDKLEKTVVVAGDTSNGLHGLKFLQKMRNKGFRVFACDGNHEHYSNVSRGRDHEDTVERFRSEFPMTGLLDLGTPIVLVNGWYHVTVEATWQRMMNDSRNSGFLAETVNHIAVTQANIVKAAVQRWANNGDIGVVVTHTAPCQETLDPRFDGEWSNEWYWNPFMRDIIHRYGKNIAVWCHGHTHAKADKVVDGVRVVCNPRGYPGENPYWEPLTVEINT
jgi:predicted phosphodiesterase